MSFSLDIASLETAYAAGTLTPVQVLDEVFARIAAGMCKISSGDGRRARPCRSTASRSA